MDNSKIEWTDHTWNPWMGCNKVSDACTHCYLGPVLKRAGRVKEPFQGPVRCITTWRKPFIWNKKAKQLSERFKIFTCSLSDYFHEEADQWRTEAWDIIRECTSLDWQILTKRSHRIAECLPEDWGEGWSHVWLGVTVENQEQTQRLDDLLAIPAAIRFVSAEPLLESLDIKEYLENIDWVITGCENAAQDKRRKMEMDWVRDLFNQCDVAGVAFFLKQYYGGATGNQSHQRWFAGWSCKAGFSRNSSLTFLNKKKKFAFSTF